MKFIVWGAGEKGRLAYEILGADRIMAYVDQNKSLDGTMIGDCMIHHTDYIEHIKDPVIILITPVKYEKEIADELREKGIHNYLFFSEYPYGVDVYGDWERMEWNFKNRIEKSSVAICGITWFNLYLYDSFSNAGMNPVLYSGEDNKEALCKLLMNEGYNICNGLNDIKGVDYILGENPKMDVKTAQCIDLNSFLETLYPVFNKKIEQYKDIHKGKRCFIIATGPSLRISDLDVLDKNHEICFSMNRIYNLFDRTEWRPDYYVIEDRQMIEDLSEEIADLKLPNKFVCEEPRSYWENYQAADSIKFKMIMSEFYSGKVGFSRNLEKFAYHGFTVTYICLQLAVYMGFSEIYLLGVDFNYSKDIYAESNHFEGYQRYYRDIRLNQIYPERMEIAYKKAKEIASKEGISIYNATRGGKLEVFERVDIDTVLQEKEY